MTAEANDNAAGATAAPDIRSVPIDVRQATQLADRMLRLCDGWQTPTVEMALVIAYGHVAGAVRQYPGPTADRRRWRFVLKGMLALVTTALEVGRMSVDDLAAEELHDQVLVTEQKN